MGVLTSETLEQVLRIVPDRYSAKERTVFILKIINIVNVYRASQNLIVDYQRD